MNTLSKAYTRHFFSRESGYDELELRWRYLLKSGIRLRPEAHLLYAILRGKDYRKGFTAATNKNKLDNGYDPDHALKSSFWIIRSGYYNPNYEALFGDILSKDWHSYLKNILPESKFNIREGYLKEIFVPVEKPAVVIVQEKVNLKTWLKKVISR